MTERRSFEDCVSTSSVHDFDFVPPPEVAQNFAAYASITNRKTFKTLKDTQEAVWPPQLEAVFLEALLAYKKDDSPASIHLGRHKNRNKFIADYIERVTGKQRTAKQVGSRIQQLRVMSVRHGADVTDAEVLRKRLADKRTIPSPPPSPSSPATTSSYGESFTMSVFQVNPQAAQPHAAHDTHRATFIANGAPRRPDSPSSTTDQEYWSQSDGVSNADSVPSPIHRDSPAFPIRTSTQRAAAAGAQQHPYHSGNNPRRRRNARVDNPHYITTPYVPAAERVYGLPQQIPGHTAAVSQGLQYGHIQSPESPSFCLCACAETNESHSNVQIHPNHPIAIPDCPYCVSSPCICRAPSDHYSGINDHHTYPRAPSGYSHYPS